ncbi:MAG TPA: type II CRISPR RNA-guided endonuclease Cas9 [Phycisphaerales bacterium]|nr:type II CRISPR RNA-guided endonuclease Cas9 [Phycisphaerales bacterium]
MRILGLDIGTTSIGWALVDDEQEEILGTGVRIFPEGVDRDQQGGEQAKTQTRREKRGQRRQIARRARRKRQLRELLGEHGLLPTDPDEADEVLIENPYPLRLRALDEKLTLYEIGRVFVHLNQRRGFKSNRKTDKKANEEKGMLAEISGLAKRIEETGSRTLGEYLARIGAGELLPAEGEIETVRNRHTRRDMYEVEFEAVWTAQARHHSDLLTNDFKEKIRRIIFFQRDLRRPKSVVGRCDLEPRLKRCPKAERIAQRFRIVQEVNNLKIIDRTTGEERRLSSEERETIIGELSKRKKVSFDSMRKKLKFTDEVRFNFETDDGSGRDHLKGHETDCALAAKSNKKNAGALGNDYWKLDERTRDRIVTILIDEDDEQRALELLQQRCGLTAEQAERVLGVDLPVGYASFSKYVIRKLLPHMERGLLVMGNDETDSAMHAAGFLRPDERAVNETIFLDQSPDLPNPIVRRALVEVRKVVNAITRELCDDRVKAGKRPYDAIHIELGREAKASFEQREKMRSENAKRRKMREQAAEEIEKTGEAVRRKKINKYLLWQEQDRTCPYTGKPISLAQLLSDAVDVDHILPRWRSLDDSMMNKVMVFREANAEKGDRTPAEWLEESDPKRYAEVLMRAKKLPYPKYRRFIQKDIQVDDFVARQLNDMRYISRLVTQYLRPLGADIVMPRGSMTAELRRRWELNNILSDDGEKTRADHRHHAVDAVAIALTNRSRLKALADGRGKVKPPWNGLRRQAEDSILGINVSHRVQRRLAGALHEETFYGPTQKHREDDTQLVAPGSVGGGRDRRHAKGWQEDSGAFVRRKNVEEIKTAKHLAKVRDAGIRTILADHLRRQGVDPMGKGKYPKDAFKGVNAPVMPSGVPIKKVRMIEESKTFRPVSNRRWYHNIKPGNNHHIVYREKDGKSGPTWNGEVITMMEAAKRGRSGRPLVDITPETENGRFVMSLALGELFEIDGENGQRLLCTVRKLDQRSKRLDYKLHTDARQSGEINKDNLYLSPKAMQARNARKVTVDPIGRIRRAGD